MRRSPEEIKDENTKFTDNLETVERYQRVGYTIEGEIIFYGQDVYERPVYPKLTYDLFTDPRPELRPLYNSYTDTNRPSTRIYMDERGLLNERLVDDPFYWTQRTRDRGKSFWILVMKDMRGISRISKQRVIKTS